MDEISAESIVYVRLFEEGSPCWAPVPADRLSETEYILHGQDSYDPGDKVWQFTPGTRVLVEKHSSGFGTLWESHLRAVKALEGVAYLGDYGIAGSKLHSFDRCGDKAQLILISNGYGRRAGQLFGFTFSQVISVEDNSSQGQEIFGLCEVVVPGHPRLFRLMDSCATSCLRLCAESYTLHDYAVGDEDIHDSQVVEIARRGADVIVTLESSGWKRSKGSKFQLVFKEAVILLDERSRLRYFYSLSVSTDESGKKTFWFSANDDEPCLQIQAAALVVEG